MHTVGRGNCHGAALSPPSLSLCKFVGLVEPVLGCGELRLEKLPREMLELWSGVV